MKWPFVIFCLTVSLFGAVCCTTNIEKLPPPPIRVEVVTADIGSIVKRLSVSGNLVYDVNTIVSAQVSAQVLSIDTPDGGLVSHGQLLLTFDPSRIHAAVEQARSDMQRDQATLDYQRLEVERNRPLLESGSISQNLFDQIFSHYQFALRQVEADANALAKLEEDLRHTRVLCPIEGVMSDRFIQVGDFVIEGTKLFLISDFRKIRMEPFLTDREVGSLDLARVFKGGIDAEVTVDALPGKIFTARLSYLQSVANDNRLFQTRFYLDNPQSVLLQGMFARGSVALSSVDNVVRIPRLALLEEVRENASNAVYIAGSDNKAHYTQVDVGVVDPRFVQIVKGLEHGAIVVVYGHEVLVEGQPLDPTILDPSELFPSGSKALQGQSIPDARDISRKYLRKAKTESTGSQK